MCQPVILSNDSPVLVKEKRILSCLEVNFKYSCLSLIVFE